MAKKKTPAPKQSRAENMAGASAFTGRAPAALTQAAQAYIRGQTPPAKGSGAGPRAATPPLKQRPSAQSAVAARGAPKSSTPGLSAAQKKIASILKPQPNDPKKWAAEEAQVQKMLSTGAAKLSKGIKSNQAQIQKKILDPEIAELEREGIPADRAKEMVGSTGLDPEKGSTKMNRLPLSAEAQAYIKGRVSTPAAQDAAQSAIAAVAQSDPTAGIDPNDKAQVYAAAVLQDAGLPVNADNIKLLETQMKLESTGAENNPLATTVTGPGSTSFNSVGVQNFPTEAEGEAAAAQTFKQQNMKTIYDALATGTATPEQYATALSQSAYEGSSDPAANAQYAQGFLQDYGLSDTAFTPMTSNAPAGGGGGGAGGGGGGGGGATTGGGSTGGQSALAALLNNPTSLDPSVISNLAGLGNSFFAALGGGASGTPSGTASDIAAQSTLAANTTNAPGSPDQTPSQQQMTNVPTGQQYQNALMALIPNIRPGASRGS
jgi:hypothetical protein